MAEMNSVGEASDRRPMGNNSPRGGNDRGGRSRDNGKQEKWREQKLRNAEEVGSIVLVPRSPDARTIVEMLRAYDRAVNNIRRRMGAYITMPVANDALKRASGFAQRFQAFVEKTFQGGAKIDLLQSPTLGLQDKITLAGSPNSFVFVPNCEETRVIARTSRVLDSYMIEFRNTCDDEKRRSDVVAAICAEILEMHRVTNEITAVSHGNDENLARKWKYRPPTAVKRLLGLSEDDAQLDGQAKPGQSNLPLDKSEKAGKGSKALAA